MRMMRRAVVTVNGVKELWRDDVISESQGERTGCDESRKWRVSFSFPEELWLLMMYRLRVWIASSNTRSMTKVTAKWRSDALVKLLNQTSSSITFYL